MYNLKIMDIFANPKNTGIVRNADGVGECKNTESGEIIKFYIKLEDKKVKECKYKAFGSALLIATGSIVTEMLIGKTMEEFRKEGEEQAKTSVKNRLVLEAIVKAEDIKADEDEINTKVTEMAEAYGKKPEELKQNEQFMNYINEFIQNEKVVNFIVDNAKKTKK